MATSTGEALLSGLERGFRLGMEIEDRKLRQQESKRQQARQERQDWLQERRMAQEEARQAKADERLAKQDRRQEEEDALKALDQERLMLRDEMAGAYRSSGGQIAKDQLDPFLQRIDDLDRRKMRLLRQRWEPIVLREKQWADDTISRLKAGQISVEQLGPDEFVTLVTASSRREPTDFLRGPNGEPSRVGQAIADFEAGMESDNQDLVLRAVNVLLEPEMRMGIGARARDGSEIKSKRIKAFVPTPGPDGQPSGEGLMPVLEVETERQDGAKGSYPAPWTKGRSTRDDDEIMGAIDMEKAMALVHNLKMLEEMANSEAMRPTLEEGIKQVGQTRIKDFLTGFYLLGGRDEDLRGKPAKREIKTTDLGGEVLERTLDEQGNVVSERRIPKTERPGVRGGGSGGGKDRRTPFRKAMDDLQDLLESGEIDQDEYDRLVEQLREKHFTRSQTGEVNRQANEAEARAAANLGLRRVNGQWVDERSRPASASQLQQLRQARDAALEATGGAPKGAPAPAVQAPAAPQFQKDKVYVNAAGQRAKYGGKDAQGKDIWLKAD